MNLILFRRSEVDPNGKSVTLPDQDYRTRHIFGHLRKVDGDSVTIGIVSGGRGKATVRTNDGKSRLEFDPSLVLSETERDHEHESGMFRELVLVLSLPFPKRLKGLWAQITSMGVTRICIIRGALSDPNYCKSSAITPQVYRPLVEEGMSQGCHTRQVTVDVEVGEVVSRAVLDKLGLVNAPNKDGVAIFLDCGDETMDPPPCGTVLRKHLGSTTRRILLAIGSERGWTDDEAALFHEAGYESASLGPSILRVDTAIIAGLGIVTATLDELGREQTEHGEAGDSSRKRKQDA